jgi:hypothetical protein
MKNQDNRSKPPPEILPPPVSNPDEVNDVAKIIIPVAEGICVYRIMFLKQM